MKIFKCFHNLTPKLKAPLLESIHELFKKIQTRVRQQPTPSRTYRTFLSQNSNSRKYVFNHGCSIKRLIERSIAAIPLVQTASNTNTTWCTNKKNSSVFQYFRNAGLCIRTCVKQKYLKRVCVLKWATRVCVPRTHNASSHQLMRETTAQNTRARH